MELVFIQLPPVVDAVDVVVVPEGQATQADEALVALMPEVERYVPVGQASIFELLLFKKYPALALQELRLTLAVLIVELFGGQLRQEVAPVFGLNVPIGQAVTTPLVE